MLAEEQRGAEGPSSMVYALTLSSPYTRNSKPLQHAEDLITSPHHQITLTQEEFEEFKNEFGQAPASPNSLAFTPTKPPPLSRVHAPAPWRAGLGNHVMALPLGGG